MKNKYCTLFDSFYLDKGLLMVRSLINCSEQAEVFVYAFDDFAYEVLERERIERVHVIDFETIITDEIVELRRNRSRAEFCWSMTPFIIEYSIHNWSLENCTYIDADLFFFKDPACLIDEMFSDNASVQVVEHRFKNNLKYRRVIKRCGRYCVEFNTFLSNEEGMRVLEDWKKKCFDCCTSDWNTGTFGDQKYLDDWEKNFGRINVLSNHGGGMAPWNIENYALINTIDNQYIQVSEKKTKEKYELVFYHFHDLVFLNERTIDINLFTRSRTIDKFLVKRIYDEYCHQLYIIREYLSKCYNWKQTFSKRSRLLWTKSDSLSLYSKVAKIVYLPQSIFDRLIIKPKDYIYVQKKEE